MPKKDRLVNPYVAGNPIQEESGFFGRDHIIEWVEQELRAFGSSVLVLRGQRRIGKTTLLLQLKRLLPPDDFLPIYFNLQLQAQRPVKNVLVALAEHMAKASGEILRKNRRSVLRRTEDNGQIFGQEFLPSFFERIGSRRPVVLLDEFDVLQDDATAKSLFEFFSVLTTDYPKLAFIITTGRDPADLSKDYSAMFKAAFAKDVWVIDSKSANDLVRQAEANHTLSFSQEAVDRILTLTHCHPFLTQLLCQRLWQRAHYGPRARDVQELAISPDDVEAVVEDALETGELQFSWLWNGLSPAEKVYIAALAAISDENRSILEDEVIEVLSKHAERFRTSQVEVEAPQYLVKRNILEKTGERQYRFAIELMRRWVQRNRPLQTVKRELDESNETAERLSQLGESYMARQEWTAARIELERALKEKPDHLKSLVNLGETLIKLESLEEAVQVLDRAHKLDPEEVRVPLARALVNYAQDAYKKGDEDRALEASEKALRLSPHERGAKTIKTTIWNRRGDEALERNDLVSALEAYRNAGNDEKLRSIYDSQKEDSEKLRATLQINPESLVLKTNLDHSIYALAFSPDNVFLASGSGDGNVILWGPSKGTLMRTLSGHSAQINSVNYSPKGTLLASGASDKTIILWDASIGRQLQTLAGHVGDVESVVFSITGTLLASGSKDHTIILWDVNTGHVLRSLERHSGEVSSVSFSPNGQLLASGSRDHTIIIWDMTNYQPLHILTGHSNRVNCVLFSPDGTTLASGSSDGSIILWDVVTGQQVRTLIKHTDEVRGLTFSPDAIVLASGSKDRNVILWHIATGIQLISLDGTAEILSVAFSNSGGSLAFSSDDGTLQIWKIKSF